LDSTVAAPYRRRIAPIGGNARAAAVGSTWSELGPGEPALSEWRQLGLPLPDLVAMRGYRLERVQAQLRMRGLGAILLTDPLNTRYAVDSTNMQIWCMHNPVRFVFVGASGPVVLFDFHGQDHLSRHLTLVSEIRPAPCLAYFATGENSELAVRRFVAEIIDLMRDAGSGRCLAVDSLPPEAVAAFTAASVNLRPGQGIMEAARAIKSDDEIAAMRCAMAATEAGIDAMHAALRPGITEQALWSLLHAANIARGGEWIETRLLSSGPRTNPWFQECSSRVIEAGDLVAFDTDLIGPFGYCADISRTWLCGGGRPSAAQAELLDIAQHQIAHNLALIKPGTTLAQIGAAAFELPANCIANRYSVIVHGVGLCDEYPCVYYPQDRNEATYDCGIAPGMVLCVESYVGRTDGREGVKLERQVLVTEAGHEILDRYPMRDPAIG